MKVITNSGLGNRKVGEKEFSYQEREGVVFVVVDGITWYTRPMSGQQGMEDDRRDFIRQIQYAIDNDELEYYNGQDEYDFLQGMVDWSSMEHAKVPKRVTRKEARNALHDVLGYAKVETYRRPHDKLSRNSRCPCGSGIKYKKCHGV